MQVRTLTPTSTFVLSANALYVMDRAAAWKAHNPVRIPLIPQGKPGGTAAPTVYMMMMIDDTRLIKCNALNACIDTRGDHYHHPPCSCLALGKLGLLLQMKHGCGCRRGACRRSDDGIALLCSSHHHCVDNVLMLLVLGQTGLALPCRTGWHRSNARSCDESSQPAPCSRCTPPLAPARHRLHTRHLVPCPLSAVSAAMHSPVCSQPCPSGLCHACRRHVRRPPNSRCPVGLPYTPPPSRLLASQSQPTMRRAPR